VLSVELFLSNYGVYKLAKVVGFEGDEGGIAEA